MILFLIQINLTLPLRGVIKEFLAKLTSNLPVFVFACVELAATFELRTSLKDGSALDLRGEILQYLEGLAWICVISGTLGKKKYSKRISTLRARLFELRWSDKEKSESPVLTATTEKKNNLRRNENGKGESLSLTSTRKAQFLG